MNSCGDVWCGVCGGAEKWNKMRNEVWWDAVVRAVPFIGWASELRRRGAGGEWS
jgi:hypothetical protein